MTDAHQDVSETPYANLQEAVLRADDLGFWALVMPHHYMWGEPFGRGVEQPNSTLDTWVALSYLAAKTSRVKLGTLVTRIPFRPPGILGKMVSTLDILSSGRTVLGVGAGWSQVEFEGYSEWNDAKTRVDKTEEGVSSSSNHGKKRRLTSRENITGRTGPYWNRNQIRNHIHLSSLGGGQALKC